MEALACHPLGMSDQSIFMSGTDLLEDTIKVRMQLSRRARAPGVSQVPQQVSRRADSIATGKKAGVHHDRKGHREARNILRPIQRTGCSHGRYRTQNGYPFYLLRVVQASSCQPRGQCYGSCYVFRYVLLVGRPEDR